MTILMALAKGFAQKRPAKGRAILMFQLGEENGAGAAAPRAGPVNCASRGMRISLSGKTSACLNAGGWQCADLRCFPA